LIIAANYRWRIPFAGAFVLGNVVVCRSDADALISSPALLGHEERHCSQYAWCLGLPFLPLYFLAAGWSQLRTGDPASGNFFERRAGLEAGGYTERNKRRRAAPDGGTMEVQA
jgi:K+ transporter